MHSYHSFMLMHSLLSMLCVGHFIHTGDLTEQFKLMQLREKEFKYNLIGRIKAHHLEHLRQKFPKADLSAINLQRWDRDFVLDSVPGGARM